MLRAFDTLRAIIICDYHLKASFCVIKTYFKAKLITETAGESKLLSKYKTKQTTLGWSGQQKRRFSLNKIEHYTIELSIK